VLANKLTIGGLSLFLTSCSSILRSVGNLQTLFCCSSTFGLVRSDIQTIRRFFNVPAAVRSLVEKRRSKFVNRLIINILHSEPWKRDILFLTIALANLSRFYSSYIISTVKNSTCDDNKIYHITRFMCAPYRVVRTEPVCCEPRHRRVESSSVGLCRRWRRTFWKLLMIATLKITVSKWQHCKFDNWRWLSVLFCCERNWTKNNSVLTKKCCYLTLRSKVRTQLRWCDNFYYSRM